MRVASAFRIDAHHADDAAGGGGEDTPTIHTPPGDDDADGDSEPHLLSNEPHNEGVAHSEKLIVNYEGT